MRKHSECLESMRIVLLGGCRIDVLLKVESTAHGRLLGRTVTASHQSSFLPSFLPSFFLSSILHPSPIFHPSQSHLPLFPRHLSRLPCDTPHSPNLRHLLLPRRIIVVDMPRIQFPQRLPARYHLPDDHFQRRPSTRRDGLCTQPWLVYPFRRPETAEAQLWPMNAKLYGFEERYPSIDKPLNPKGDTWSHPVWDNEHLKRVGGGNWHFPAFMYT
jgi:hypothetical protein